jgi:beta-lactamase regulating signal transducer with metallopeptidase domain
MASLVHSLFMVTMASSAAVVLIGALRKPLRYTVGARAAYWIWLLVPASIVGVLLPASSHSVRTLAASLPQSVSAAYSAVIISVNETASSSYCAIAMAIWMLGGVLMLIWALSRQRAFIRSLGEMTPDPQGFHRSPSIVAPLLVGAWNPIIVVPANFEERYGPSERLLVLAHERAHLVRLDVFVNVVSTCWLCLAWFNPLMYWALGRLRFDQELACDESVLASTKTPRRLYAEALLKTQLANESAWRLPAGCHWQSIHPLKERVAMLKRSSPSSMRRFWGVTIISTFALTGGYTAWAIQTESPSTGDPSKVIAVHFKWWVNGKDVLQVSGPMATQDIRVASGNEFVEKVSFAPGQSFETRCFASLSNEDRASPIWDTAKASGHSIEGLILFECKLSTNDKVFSTPALMVGNGKIGTIETYNPEGNVHYKLELQASTVTTRTAAAR